MNQTKVNGWSSDTPSRYPLLYQSILTVKVTEEVVYNDNYT
jgi:hypothetical protein